MKTMADKFASALGVWGVKIGGIELELKPDMKDIRMFRKLMLNDDNKKDKAGMMDRFCEYLSELIIRFNPNDEKESIKAYVELYAMELFNEALIAFKFTTKEDLEKAKDEATNDIKKLIESS